MTDRKMSAKGLLLEAARCLARSPRSRLRQASALRALDTRLLADIGLMRDDALRGYRGRKDRAMTLAPEVLQVPDNGPRVTVRESAQADMVEVQRIYAHNVLTGLASFEEKAPSLEDMLARRATVLAAGLPYLVAKVDDRVAGYAYASDYRPRPAYRYTVENSVYVADELQGLGIGRSLLGALIARCEAGPWRQMVAVIGDSGNVASIALHEKLGFRMVGRLEAVGFKLGRWVDTVLMQRSLGQGGRALPPGVRFPRLEAPSGRGMR